MKKIFINGTIILKNGLKKANLLINDKIIEGFSNEILPGYEIIDAKGAYIAPGLVDIHTHGRNGCDTMNGTIDAINTMSVNALKTGVTSFLPTTMTQSIESTKNALKACYEYKGKEKGSKVLGVHMEGPFIELKKKGAQPGIYVLKPSIEDFKKLTGEYVSIVELVTLAPEIENANHLIHYLKDQNITVSMGHTNANYEQAKMAFIEGIDHATHTFNAMNGFTHREPGAVGAIFDTDEVFAELILDGIHVHFAAAKTLIKEKGIGRVCLITDSMEASGLEDGKYQLGGQDVYVKNNEARLEDGTLAGSVLKLNQAVYNAYLKLHLPIYEAVRLASYNPAKSIHHEEIGEIAPNKKADIILINDQIEILRTFIEGEEIVL